MGGLGIWLWPQDVYDQGAEAVFARCAAFGVTDAFLLTKGLAGRVAYHRTKLRLEPMYQGRDILEESIVAAHKRGIRLHAWFTSANDAAYKEKHPEAGNAHILHGKDNSVIRMRDEGYCGYMEALVAELFATYAVDGLHLDYIRFNHISNGWAQEDMDALAARGVQVDRLKALVQASFYGDAPQENLIFDAYRAGDSDVLGLAMYRRETVTAFAGRLIAAARRHRPALPVSAALMPEGAYPDIAFSDLHYGQNYEDAAKLFDFVVPMAYHVEYGQAPEWVAEVALGAIRRGNRVMAGVQAYGVGTAADAQAAMEAVCRVEDAMLEGPCVFRYGEPACDGLMAAQDM